MNGRSSNESLGFGCLEVRGTGSSCSPMNLSLCISICLNNRFGMLRRLMLDTGLRIGEVLSLTLQNVHLTPAKDARYGYLTVRASHAKNSKSRNIPLTDRAFNVLINQSATDGYVFHRENGSRLYQTWLDEQHRAVRETLSLPEDFVLHSCRHTFGTRLWRSRCRRLHYNEAHGPQHGNDVTEVRSSLPGVVGNRDESAGSPESIQCTNPEAWGWRKFRHNGFFGRGKERGSSLESTSPGGEIGRRKGLKILWEATPVWVQVPPRAPVLVVCFHRIATTLNSRARFVPNRIDSIKLAMRSCRP